MMRSLALGISVAITLTLTLPSGISKAADDPLERGAYLVMGIVACGSCHTPKGPDGRAVAGQEFAGGVVFDEPAFRAVASNITPDRETGIGNWTDAQIINSIRNGKRPDGSTIGPPMPVQFYRDMSDTDVTAIVAYLRSVKPISHKVPKSSYNIPLPDSYGTTVTKVADVPRGDDARYGQYLAGIAHCMLCHSPMEDGRLDLTRVGAGGREFHSAPLGTAVSSNLTPANPDGISHWTDNQVKQTIATGVRPDGRRLVRLMAFDWYKNVDSDDLDALVAYLRTLKPATP